MQLVLILPESGKWLGHDDKFVEDQASARIFDNILSADCYSAYIELTYGVQCYAGLKDKEGAPVWKR